MSPANRKIVLAYSGSLSTSVAIPWLKERYEAEVVAVTLDLGQRAELNQVRDRAIAAGAARCHVLDVREEFARDYIIPSLQADALYEEYYPLATALSRPLIARKLVEIAHMENASAIAHGCTGKEKSEQAVDVSARAIDPAIEVIAPARVWEMTRADQIAYALERQVPVPASTSSPYAIDQNLWARSIECGAPGDSTREPPEDVYTLTKKPADAPDAAACVEIDFDKGVPAAVNGVEMLPVELIGSLETIAAVHGVGRLDMVENGFPGTKSRKVFEAPAAVVLHLAYRELENLVTPEELQRLKRPLSREYTGLVDNGLWFSPTRKAIDAFVESFQHSVSGSVRLELHKGNCKVVGRKSPHALYDRRLAAGRPAGESDHAGAGGLDKLLDLPVETAARSARPKAKRGEPAALEK